MNETHFFTFTVPVSSKTIERFVSVSGIPDFASSNFKEILTGDFSIPISLDHKTNKFFLHY